MGVRNDDDVAYAGAQKIGAAVGKFEDRRQGV
jgi:hypothetical protein